MVALLKRAGCLTASVLRSVIPRGGTILSSATASVWVIPHAAIIEDVSVEQPATASAADLCDRIRQLETALESRTVIARAQGIIMERYEIDADAAFEVLRRISSATNVRVRDIATALVETRRLPRVR